MLYMLYFFDKMSLFNDKLKNITLKELLSLIIILFLIYYSVNALNIFHIESYWIYVLIVLYFVFKLKCEISSLKDEFRVFFSPIIIREILLVVILNIFLSYGMLYFANFILGVVPSFNLFNSLLTGTLIATVFVSPVCEELIFRGVFLNRLQLAVPVIFAVLISSLLFASLHSYGSIFSAFIFGICTAILYLKTNNILVPIIAHFLNNLFAETIVFLDSNDILFANTSVVLVISILAFVSFVIILINIVRELKKIK